MRFSVAFIFFFLTSSTFGQGFFKVQYDKYFPNNKSIQLEKANRKIDSLNQVNSGLKSDLENAALEKDSLLTEISDLNELLIAEKEKQEGSNTELIKENAQLKDSIAYLNFPVVACKEEAIIKKGVVDPTLRNTCTWRHYEIIEMGIPDNRKRYKWTTEIRNMLKDSTRLVDNSELFIPEKVSELEKMINERIKEDFKAMRESDPECIPRRKVLPTYKLKDMRIVFNDDSEIFFEVQYGLSETCFAVNTASTGFKIQELKEFFVQDLIK